MEVVIGLLIFVILGLMILLARKNDYIAFISRRMADLENECHSLTKRMSRMRRQARDGETWKWSE